MSLATVSLPTNSLGTIVPRYNVPNNNVLTTIVPCDNYSSVPLQMVISKEDGPQDDQHFFGWMGLKFAPDLSLVWRVLNTKFQLKQTNGSGVRAK